MKVTVSAGELFAEVELEEAEYVPVRIVATLNNCVDAVTALISEYDKRGLYNAVEEEGEPSEVEQ